MKRSFRLCLAGFLAGTALMMGTTAYAGAEEAVFADDTPLFPAVADYEGFSDVSETDWFAPYVKLCVETGLMKGVGDGRFDPQGRLTRAEAAAVALRIHHVRNGGDGTLPKAPEEWGRMTLTFADGKVWSGYRKDSGGIEGWYLTGRTGNLLCFSRAEGWEGKDYQQVTLDLGDEDQIPGEVHFLSGTPETLCFYSQINSEGVTDESVSQRYRTVMSNWRWGRPGPDKWWRDVSYYQQQVGLQEVYDLSPDDGAQDRMGFVHALDAVSDGLLTPINHTDDYPDSYGGQDDPVLDFYRAGILTGVDEYGTFGGRLGLTRAEMAAMASRLIRPELRVEFTPKTPEYAKYTLTEISVPEGFVRDDGWDPAPNCLLMNCINADGVAVGWGALRADGSMVAFPEGCYVNSWWENSSADVTLVTLMKSDPSVWASKGVMDLATGEMVVPFGHYDWCHVLADGTILTKENNYDAGEPYLLRDSTGAEVARLYGSASWVTLRDGLAPCYDTELKLWGYVDVSGQWVIPPRYGTYTPFADGYVGTSKEVQDGKWYYGVIDVQGNEVLPFRYEDLEYRGDGLFREETFGEGESRWVDVNGTETVNGYVYNDIYRANGYIALGNRYLDRNFLPITPKEFDWTGPIGKDGAGFAGLDGKIYRIQFGQ